MFYSYLNSAIALCNKLRLHIQLTPLSLTGSLHGLCFVCKISGSLSPIHQFKLMYSGEILFLFWWCFLGLVEFQTFLYVNNGMG